MYGKKLTICVENEVYEHDALELAKKLGTELSTKLGNQLTLLFSSDGVYLTDGTMSFRGDFEQMLRRISGGRLQHEILARIVKSKSAHPTAADATAGMGSDSLLLAACGYEVTMFEQNPVIAALLRDALHRAEASPELKKITERMRLFEGSSTELLPQLDFSPDVIYLDPMFPARQKSGLVNKRLQLIQELEQPCIEETKLLDAAASVKPKKIIIKRPLKGAYLAGRKPHYTVKGKAIRYDCFSFSSL